VERAAHPPFLLLRHDWQSRSAWFE
jgi:hypothetical protein